MSHAPAVEAIRRAWLEPWDAPAEPLPPIVRPTHVARGRRMGRPTVYQPGVVVGRLTLVRLVRRLTYGHTLWLCRCACGGSAFVRSNHLRSGQQKSCGCLPSAPRAWKFWL